MEGTTNMDQDELPIGWDWLTIQIPVCLDSSTSLVDQVNDILKELKTCLPELITERAKEINSRTPANISR